MELHASTIEFSLIFWKKSYVSYVFWVPFIFPFGLSNKISITAGDQKSIDKYPQKDEDDSSNGSSKVHCR